jgi:hypothetical protein
MKRPRKPASLSQSVHDRLNIYALAASAAGVSLLALAPPSEAEIIYTKAYHVIPKGGHYNLDLNHDGKTDFSFVDRFNCTEDFCPNALLVNPTGENGVEGRQGFLQEWAYALPQGAHIGPGHPFSGQVMASSDAGYLGSWVNVTNRYLGFKFKIRGATHYGWARLDVSVIGGIVVGTLTGYAYETIPNMPIIAGKTKGRDVITVQWDSAPVTLGRLAAGRK